MKTGIRISGQIGVALFFFLIRNAYAELPVIIEPFFTMEQKFEAGGGAAFDNMGNSVAIDGDVAVVGAFRDGDGSESGAAYVYARKDNVWIEHHRLVPSDLSDGDLFGRFVAVSGDTIDH